MLGASGGVHSTGNERRRNFDRAFKVEAVRLITEEKRKVTQEGLIGIGNDHRLRVFSSNDYVWPDYTLNDIGQFKNPKPLLNTVDTTIYWDTQSSTSDIYLSIIHLPEF